MSEVSIKLSLSNSKNGLSIDDREQVIAILNDTMMRIDNNIGPQSSTQYLLESIKNENPNATFRFEWKPKDKYKTIFDQLKKSNTEFRLLFIIQERENAKIHWGFTATAEKATVKNVLKGGNTNNSFQTIDIKCKNFDYRK